MREKAGCWSRRDFLKAAASALAGRIVAGREAGMGGFETAGAGDLAKTSLSEASQLVQAKKVSPVELTVECLKRIDRLNRKLNAFVTVTAESALAQAREAEAEIQKGQWKGPLHGIPIALKDLVDTAGVRTTAGSALFKERVPTQDAEIVRRLKAAGAVLLGKLNMHEFAFGGSSVISVFGPVRNPWSVEYSPGGSSGGSAAAVAAGLCYGAIGSDTGGSIREPAGYCGIVGLKPTYGRVSTRGVIPLSWSLDHIGPLTRTVRDAALMLQTLAGYDAEDVTSANLPVPDYAAPLEKKTSFRLGIPRAYFYEQLHPEIEAAMTAALAVLGKLAAGQRDLEIPTGADFSGTVLVAEAYAYHEENAKQNPQLYQPETLKRIRAGGEISASAYIAARRQLEQLRRATPKIFETADILVTPTFPVPPPKISVLLGEPDKLRGRELLMLRNTRPFNVLGLPTISVPCGFTGDGLPIGMQLTGMVGGEVSLLGLAHAYEQATEWHKHAPF
jgi:aspartyl-tRNA(Asn)/glutamyl-tRNA(Gln) amidotransferase subunit A